VHEGDSESGPLEKEEKYFEERVQEHVKLPRGKRTGPHEPAGRIQLRLLVMSRCADIAGWSNARCTVVLAFAGRCSVLSASVW